MEQDREEYDRKVQAISKQVETFGEIFFFHFVIFPLFPVDLEGRSSGKAAGDDRCSKEDL